MTQLLLQSIVLKIITGWVNVDKTETHARTIIENQFLEAAVSKRTSI
jgi:hypothetical protein